MKRRIVACSLALALMVSMVFSVSAAQTVPASGEFEVDIDPDDINLTPLGANCVLQVEGDVSFTGDLTGDATAQTTALVFAPCDVVAESPPGSVRDVFSSTMEFSGTLNGDPVEAGIHYHGRVEEGGQLSGIMNFFGDLRGAVQVDGQAGVDGSYSGTIVLK